MHQTWEDLAARKRLSILAQIPEQWLLPEDILKQAEKERSVAGDFIEGLLDKETAAVTSLDPVEILEQIRTRSRSAYEVTLAFCKRAAYAHQLNACCLEIFFDQALVEARSLDEYQRINATTIGPLHGLPVSLKDQFHVKDVETTMGYVGWIHSFEGKQDTGKEGIVESELVLELRSLGAIPIVKTTLSQGLMSGETSNNILGYNKNPVNQKLSSGGSSGGEGSLQALRGSAIGFATDIGGSVIIPSAFCGVYGFKPSTGRISYRSAANTTPGQAILPSTIGIMGPGLSSLELTFKALLATEPWLRDPDVIRMPWQCSTGSNSTDARMDELFSFGIIKSNDIARPHPPISRALRMVSKALRRRGQDVVEWETAAHKRMLAIHGAFMTSDGFNDVHSQLALSGEPPTTECHREIGDGPKPPMPLLDFFALTTKLKAYRQEMADQWASTARQTQTGRPVDAVILPVTPHAAVIPGKFYTSFPLNVRDYCSIVIPVTTADKDLDPAIVNYEPINELDGKNQAAYDPELYHGAPAAVQIVCPRYHEEKLFNMAKVLDEALRKS